MTTTPSFNSTSGDNLPGVDTAEALAFATESSRLCALGYHAWVPWLAVHYPPDVRDGALSFYETWCARKGCDHHETWDCP